MGLFLFGTQFFIYFLKRYLGSFDWVQLIVSQLNYSFVSKLLVDWTGTN